MSFRNSFKKKKRRGSEKSLESSAQTLDKLKLDEIAWSIVSKEGKDTGCKLFSDDDLFRLWRIFNKLVVDETVTINIEEASNFLQSYMTAIGNPWSSTPLEEFTSKTELTFWELITCLETKYINDTNESVYLEGLEELYKKYIDEVIKCGFLTKKGHRVKSMKSRWFVFQPHLLTYYESSRLSKKKGEIIVNSKSTVENIDDTKNAKCRFAVVCGATSTGFELEAADQRTKNEWISAIKNCIGVSDEDTPMMVELNYRADKRRESQRITSLAEMQKLEQENLIKSQVKELEDTRLKLDQANTQAETEAALKDEEKKLREEVEAVKAEYAKLLEEERLAREQEQQARAKQEEMLADETIKRQELERIKSEQDKLLETERKAREGLEEMSKEQAKALEEERKQLKLLDEARKAAEAEVEAAHTKLETTKKEIAEAAVRVEEAKNKTRNITGHDGLHKKIALGNARPSTHRGIGAFTDGDYSKTPLYLTRDHAPIPVNQSEFQADEERSEIVEIRLVKPSERAFEKHFATEQHGAPRRGSTFAEEIIYNKTNSSLGEATLSPNRTEESDDEERSQIVETSLVKPSDKLFEKQYSAEKSPIHSDACGDEVFIESPSISVEETPAASSPSEPPSDVTAQVSETHVETPSENALANEDVSNPSVHLPTEETAADVNHSEQPAVEGLVQSETSLQHPVENIDVV